VYEVTLEVGGRRLLGWKRISIERSLGAICGQFSLGILDSWERLSQSWFIQPFAECKVYIDKDQVLSGYVDNVSISESSSGTDITVSGRDVTSDLVDCSLIAKSYELSNVTLSQLVRKLILTGKFKIGYSEEAPPGKAFERIDLSPGTRYSSILEDYARYRGLFFYTDHEGTLVLAKPGSKKAKVSLIVGENIKSYQVQYDTQQRYSDYRVLAQAQGLAEFGGPSANQIQGSAKDRGVPRFRPFGFVAEISATASDSQKRAEWETTIRAAKMTTVSVDVVGWRQGLDKSAPLWEINALVDVKIPKIGLNGTFLISSVRYSIDQGGGTITTIALESPDAYKAEPLKDPQIERYLEFNSAGDDA
jgi:prophage tail gpP-like protein